MIIGVHGFGFAPGTKDNDPLPLFQAWAAMLGQPVDGFSWYSAAPVDEGDALRHGYADAYSWAYKDLATAATQRLVAKLQMSRGPIDIICHSLGSRVTLAAVAQMPSGYVRRILILDGAETQIAAPTSLPIGVQVLNACVREDMVLAALGSVFNGDHVCACIGQRGLGRDMDHWADIFLDDPATIAKAKAARGWQLGASPRHKFVTGNLVDDLRNLGDHWASYANGGNHALYRSWFAGDTLTDLIDI